MVWYKCPAFGLFFHHTETRLSNHLIHLSRFRGALRMILSTLRRSYTKLMSIYRYSQTFGRLTSAASEADETTAFLSL